MFKKKDSMSAIKNEFTARAEAIRARVIAEKDMATTDMEEEVRRHEERMKVIGTRQESADSEIQSADAFLSNVENLFRA